MQPHLDASRCPRTCAKSRAGWWSCAGVVAILVLSRGVQAQTVDARDHFGDVAWGDANGLNPGPKGLLYQFFVAVAQDVIARVASADSDCNDPVNLWNPCIDLNRQSRAAGSLNPCTRRLCLNIKEFDGICSLGTAPPIANWPPYTPPSQLDFDQAHAVDIIVHEMIHACDPKTTLPPGVTRPAGAGTPGPIKNAWDLDAYLREKVHQIEEVDAATKEGDAAYELGQLGIISVSDSLRLQLEAAERGSPHRKWAKWLCGPIDLLIAALEAEPPDPGAPLPPGFDLPKMKEKADTLKRRL